MEYRVFDYHENHNYYYDDWWDLINGIIHHHGGLSYFCHNQNDCVTINEGCWSDEYDAFINNYVKYRKTFIVYDIHDRIVNISELQEGIDNFVEKPIIQRRTYYRYRNRPLFRFRYDPVPWVNRKYITPYKRSKYNLEYFKKLKGIIQDNGYYISLSRLSAKYEIGAWYDEELVRNISKSWKDQTKKRKQWM